MRRTDREVTDKNQILEIIDGCDALSLALMDGEYPYVIEMNFGYEESEGGLRIYLHGAKDGKKLDLMRANDHCAFSMSRKHDLVPGRVECATTFKYESVCGRGRISILEGDEAVHGLTVMSKKYLPDMPNAFSAKHAAAVTVMRIDVESYTGKRREVK